MLHKLIKFFCFAADCVMEWVIMCVCVDLAVGPWVGEHNSAWVVVGL